MRVTILSQAVDTSFDRQSSPGAFFPVEPVFTGTRLHVGASEPDGAAASQRRIAGREDDLFVGSHAQHFVAMISGRRASCFDRVRDEADICEKWLS